jgi:hypothetical protein
MSSPLNTINKMNNSVVNFFEIPIIKYGFLILIILQIIFIKKISRSYLENYDNNYFKIIYAFLIAYYACFDPVYSIALTTLMIIAIQELHSRNATHSVVSLLPQQHTNNINLNKKMSNDKKYNSLNITSGKMTARIFDNDELVYDLINKHSLQKIPANNDKLTGEYEFCREPAFQTITNNLKDIENNTTDANQNISVQGLNGKILNIQGLPNGFDSKQKLL